MNYDLNTEAGMKNAVQWTEYMLGSLKDGGTWIVPRSGTAITIDKTAKVARVCYVANRAEPAIERVLTTMGYTIEVV